MKEENPKNDTSTRAKSIIKSKMDVKGGKITYGQRIELGKIFQQDENDADKFKKVFRCLHSYTPKVKDFPLLIPYFKDIIDGLAFWINQEAEKLRYDPKPEEISAGIKDLSAKTGEFGTIKALAKNYGKDPDEILQWEYGKVFGILYTDLEEFKYQQRYYKTIERKFKK